MGVLVEHFLLIDPVVGVGQRRQERAGGELQMNDDGVRVSRRDLVDHHESGGTRAYHAFRREGDLVQARRDVGSGQLVAVMERDVVADLEGVGLAAISRLRHLGA